MAGSVLSQRTDKALMKTEPHRSNGFCERRLSLGIYETNQQVARLRVDARNALSSHLSELKSERAPPSAEARAEQKRVRELLTQSRDLLKQMQAG
jgi:hypothetical protein